MYHPPVFNFQSEIQGILSFVERGCARLMKEGGGPLPQEAKSGKERSTRLEIDDDQRRQILSMAKSGLYSQSEIARIVGRSVSSINGFLTRRGIKCADGRSNAKRLPHS